MIAPTTGALQKCRRGGRATASRPGTAGSGEEVRSTSGRAISTKVSALATTASRQAQQQHLFERINHLAALPLIWKICKKFQKNQRYSVPLESRPLASSEKSNQRITTHSGLIHPITLGHSISPLTTRGLQVRIFLISGDRNVSIDPFASNRDRA